MRNSALSQRKATQSAEGSSHTNTANTISISLSIQLEVIGTERKLGPKSSSKAQILKGKELEPESKLEGSTLERKTHGLGIKYPLVQIVVPRLPKMLP